MLGNTILQIGVSSAVLEYNHGKEGIYKVMKLIGLSIGAVQKMSTENIVKRFKRVQVHKATPTVKRRRKDFWSIKKKWIDKNTEQEKKSYKAGGF